MTLFANLGTFLTTWTIVSAPPVTLAAVWAPALERWHPRPHDLLFLGDDLALLGFLPHDDDGQNPSASLHPGEIVAIDGVGRTAAMLKKENAPSNISNSRAQCLEISSHES